MAQEIQLTGWGLSTKDVFNAFVVPSLFGREYTLGCRCISPQSIAVMKDLLVQAMRGVLAYPLLYRYTIL